MSQKHVRRLSPRTLEADGHALTALQALGDYSSASPEHTRLAALRAFETLEAARAAEVKAHNAFCAARDAAIEAEWNFHDVMLGVKDQVLAQYGGDSDQAQSLGPKKKSRSSAGRNPEAG